jgi:aminoglycoside phosphotransferase family enzyme
MRDGLPPLIQALTDPARFAPPVGAVRLIETHISWVLLTGSYAYKIKKPLDLGFLDFSTLDKRRQACLDEVRLNRRLAPDIYLDVMPIAGTPESPRLGAEGEAIEYAVRMREFAADATLDRLDAEGRLGAHQIDAVAETLGQFHLDGCLRASADQPWGSPQAVWRPVEQNFLQIAPRLADPADSRRLDRLRRWSEAEHARLTPSMIERKRDGFVRECHGDLHLGNLAWVDGRPLVFDCIEFNAELRWIDIVSEVAFCFMDLVHRGHRDWAWLFLNRWLEKTGDHGGLALLRYYAVYRALVRAKVAFIRAGQGGDGSAGATAEGQAYLGLAEALSQPGEAQLEITHGLSGSGKTSTTHVRMQQREAVRLRSDVERKRLAGLDALARSGSGVASGLYAADATHRLYRHLVELADAVLQAGWPVIVDAACLARWQRDLFRELAAARGVEFRILDFPVAEAVLRERVVRRSRQGGDASEADLAVLQHQLATAEPLAADELGVVETVAGST